MHVIIVPLTVLLAGIFAGTTILISQLFQSINTGQQSAIALAIFQPTRRWLQRFVDRRFFGIQVDYQRAGQERKLPAFEEVIQTVQFGDYQIGEALGQGGMAQVFCATHPKLDKPVALKILHPHLTVEKEVSQRFQREAQTIIDLKHDHIIRVFDFGEENNTTFIVMTYIEGIDLGVYLADKGTLSLPETQSLLQGVAEALDYAHAQGLVHRDVKPSNILLDTTQTPPQTILTDFGVVKLLDATTHLTGSGVIGTFHYMAPEQIQHPNNVDGRADIYALGILAYQLLTGQLPFPNRNPGAILLAHLNQPPPPICDTNPTIPPQTEQAIIKAMAKKPEDRYPSCITFIQDLSP